MLEFITKFAADGKIDAPTGIPKVEIPTALENILATVFMFAGIVATVMIIVSGFNYITALGEPSKVLKAKHTLIGAIAGLIIVLLAFPILGFVVGSVGQ